MRAPQGGPRVGDAWAPTKFIGGIRAMPAAHVHQGPYHVPGCSSSFFLSIRFLDYSANAKRNEARRIPLRFQHGNAAGWVGNSPAADLKITNRRRTIRFRPSTRLNPWSTAWFAASPASFSASCFVAFRSIRVPSPVVCVSDGMRTQRNRHQTRLPRAHLLPRPVASGCPSTP